MNEILNIALSADGFSFEKTGFAVMRAVKRGAFCKLTFKAYTKGGEHFTDVEKPSLFILLNRLESRFLKVEKWTLIQAIVRDENKFEVMLKSEEDSSLYEEKSMEAEK